MLRKAWGVLLFIVVATIVIQVTAATIEPYIPTIITLMTISFIVFVVGWIAVLIWRILRARRRLF